MIPNTGSWAKYTLISKLSTLNGIYQLMSIESLESALNRGVDFTKLLYTPGGLTANDWTADYSNYKGNDVYWLQPTDSSASQIPVPSGALSQYPDLNVGVYLPLILRITVGLYQSPSELQYLADQVKDIVSATTGETSSVIWTSTSEGRVFKTKDEYYQLDQARKAKATQLTPLITQVAQKDKEIDDLKSRINYLEQMIIQSANKK